MNTQFETYCITSLFFILIFTSCQESDRSLKLENASKVQTLLIDGVSLPAIDKTLNDYVLENGDEFDFYNNRYFQLITDSQIVRITDEVRNFKERNLHQENIIPISFLFDQNLRQNGVVSDGLLYNSAIYCINEKDADLNKKPIISLGGGFDLDSTYKDVIPAFYLNENGKKIEFFIGEEHIEALNNPVYIIAIHTNEYVQADNDAVIIDSTFSTGNNGRSINLSADMFVDEYQINFRYDNNRKSEYNMSLMHYYASDYFHMGNNNKGIFLSKVSKNDIGKRLRESNDFTFVPNFYTNQTYYGTYVVTFEYDWWALKKYIAVDGPGGEKFHEVKTDNASHYYQRLYIPIQYNYVSFYTSNEKGFFAANIISGN